MEVDEGCRTPRRSEYQIPAPLVCPPPPKKKPFYAKQRRNPPKEGGYLGQGSAKDRQDFGVAALSPALKEEGFLNSRAPFVKSTRSHKYNSCMAEILNLI
ncbi:hypothetical protein SADUNF_Sadunf08G0045400 [Salix dunnii]|uniref:Uncharacterized protein n=1 Tax=Salix dunnii TaxID=1413687 RepID=A0A835JUR5_9ROSI|nr:hypothetical protein SADUNF_Sadunf08G0045400 [Salix dunnii]